jgi:transposase
MDNLLAHHHDATLNAILNAGHRFVFRAPYWPVDGPIEYVFNTIEMALDV